MLRSTMQVQAISVVSKPQLRRTKNSGPPVPLKIPEKILSIHSTPDLPPLESIPYPPEDKLAVYSAQNIANQKPREWSEIAYEKLCDGLSSHDVVLLKGLPITTEQEFTEFYEGIVQVANSSEWQPILRHQSAFFPRKKLGKQNLVDYEGPESLVNAHNEIVYNPKVPQYFSIMCLQDADVGGESLVCHNKDITDKSLPQELVDFINQHGGVKYTRKYYDATNPSQYPGASISWQERAELQEGQGKKEAEEYWIQNFGFEASDFWWQDDGSLVLSNVLSGFIDGLWCNLLSRGIPHFVGVADDTPVPEALLGQLQGASWRHTYSLKLKPGDWIVYNNVRVQHGRMQYKNINKKRTLLVNMWGCKPSEKFTHH